MSTPVMFRIIIRILRKTQLIKYFYFRPKISINGKQITIPVIHGMGVNQYLDPSEPWMVEILRKLLSQKQGHVFVDIGANLGQTLMKVKSTNSTVKYVGFEPNPACVYYLQMLIHENDFENTEIFPVGIGAKNGILRLNFFNDSATDSSASILENYREGSVIVKKLNVPVLEFDQAGIQDSKISFVKIDVEGAELEVLRGLMFKIKQDRPIILIEVLPVYSRDNELRWTRQKEIENVIEEADYAIFRIIKNNEVFSKLEPLDDFGIHSDLNKCDYILSPSEKATQIKGELA